MSFLLQTIVVAIAAVVALIEIVALGSGNAAKLGRCAVWLVASVTAIIVVVNT